MLLSISGISTAGKTFVLDALPAINFASMVSHTTRPMRRGELDQFDYHFKKDEIFNGLINNNKFLENVKFSGYQYGLLKTEVDNALIRAKCAVHVCTPSGSLALKNEAMLRNLRFCSVFIKAPLETVIQRHLKRWIFSRGNINLSYLSERIATSIIIEQGWTGDFNYIVPTSDGFIDLIKELNSIVNTDSVLPKPVSLISNTKLTFDSLELLTSSLERSLRSLAYIPVNQDGFSRAVNSVLKVLNKN